MTKISFHHHLDFTPERPLSRADAHSPSRSKAASQPPQAPKDGSDDLVLYGDVESLKYAFINSQRRLISASVPDSLLVKLQAYPGGVSRFFEDAVAEFDGDLRALVEAAVQFVEARRLHASSDPIRNASGRVLPVTFEKVQKIHAALAGVRGMSRAKVITGLIRIKLSTP